MRRGFGAAMTLATVVAALPALSATPSPERAGSADSATNDPISSSSGQSIVDQVFAATTRTSTNAARQREVDLGNGHRFVLVPSGPFPMGSDEGLEDERPVHIVELDDYWIAKFPVTVGQFRAFVEATEYVADAERDQGSWQWTSEILAAGERRDPWEPRLGQHLLRASQRPCGGQRQLERRANILRLAFKPTRPPRRLTDRGSMGEGGARHRGPVLPLR